VIFPRRFQVKGIEGLVDNERVGAIAPGAHHRRRNISRPRPHREMSHLRTGPFLPPATISGGSGSAQ